jgi:hypothetical protein
VWHEAENYFRASTGTVVSQWPFSATVYILGLRVAEWLAMRFDGDARRRAVTSSAHPSASLLSARSRAMTADQDMPASR